jgi:DNA polymerase-3 subunit chi
LVLIDGAQTDAAEAGPLQRVWVLFDGGDEAQLAGARALWSKLTGAGLAAQYWSEDSGKWALKVEKPANPA